MTSTPRWSYDHFHVRQTKLMCNPSKINKTATGAIAVMSSRCQSAQGFSRRLRDIAHSWLCEGFSYYSQPRLCLGTPRVQRIPIHLANIYIYIYTITTGAWYQQNHPRCHIGSLRCKPQNKVQSSEEMHVEVVRRIHYRIHLSAPQSNAATSRHQVPHGTLFKTCWSSHSCHWN